MSDPKADTRRVAFARRKAAFAARGPRDADLLDVVLVPFRGAPLAGYAAIRTEIDPKPAMARAAEHGPVALPVIVGDGQPMVFHRWEPGCAMQDGPFGARVPVSGEAVVPSVLIVPLLAFDRRGGRLGYGGGYYDRTLQKLRASGPVTAIGFAFAAQEVETVPTEPTDQPLSMVVTEAEIITI